jgi:hypothetical protein
MDEIVWLLLAMAWSLPLLVLHELGHAVAALRLTRGEIGVHVDFRGGRCLAREARRQARPERMVHPVFALVGAAAIVMALLANPWLAVLLCAIFGGAWLLQLSDQKKH